MRIVEIARGDVDHKRFRDVADLSAREGTSAGRGGREGVSGAALKGRLREIGDRLAARYGRPRRGAHEGDPLRNLILTILSQNTNDANRDRAFAELTARFPTIPVLAAAGPREVEEAIRVGGLARAKAKAILSLLARLRREQGEYALGFLDRMSLEEARRYLVSFPGVGVKTANVVLLFSFRKEAFPVDTHILRVSRRLGLVSSRADLGKAALLLEPHVPPGEHIPLHLNLIRLGRELCRPRNPRHVECPLLSLCPEGMKALGRMKKGKAAGAGERRPGSAAARRRGGTGSAARPAMGSAPRPRPAEAGRKPGTRGKAPPRPERP